MIGLFGQSDLAAVLRQPLTWGLLLGSLALWLAISARTSTIRRLGQMIGGAALLVIAAALYRVAPLPDGVHQVVFWMLSAVAVGGAAAAISARNPVYSAIWFAFSLLGVAGLFVLQNAQFLGLATVAVYAGAIVVTFLFVLMLAQPGGDSSYDRLSWSPFAVPAGLVSGCALLMAVMALDPSGLSVGRGTDDVMEQEHMARLGAEMFANHLVGVEIAGTLLLVGLVGAIAIVIHGRSSRPFAPATQTPASQTPTSHNYGRGSR